MSRSAWIDDRRDRGLRWRARYRGPDGLVRSKSFATKVNTQRWLIEQIGQVDRSAWVPPEHGQITWAQYSEQLLSGRVTSLPEPSRLIDDATSGPIHGSVTCHSFV